MYMIWNGVGKKMIWCKIYEVLKINDIKKIVLIILFYVSLYFVMWVCRVKNGEI